MPNEISKEPDALWFDKALERALGVPSQCMCKKGHEQTCQMCDCPRRRHMGLPLGSKN